MSAQYAYPVFYLGFLTLCEGGWDEAASLLDDSIRIAELIGDLQVLRWAYATRAECDLLQGRPDQARDRLTALIERTGLQGKGVAWLLLFQAWAHLELGNTTRAADLAARAVVQARAEYDQFSLTDALWVQAMVMVRQEHGDAAGPILDEGLALARRMPYPYTEGRLLYLSGLFHRARGESRPARECLEAALVVFQRLGVRKEVERTERMLAHGQEAWTRRADPVVTEAQWARIRTLLPPVSPTGRPRADDRRTLEAILYVQRTGCAWADLPPALGDDATAHRRLVQWRAAGLWPRIEEILRDPPTGVF